MRKSRRYTGFASNRGAYSGWRKARYTRRAARHARRRGSHLYRDVQHKKILGVCAGIADYFGRPAWQIRLCAVIGLIFIPSMVIPVYLIMYFLMDDKPYYRRFTDRFTEAESGQYEQDDNLSEDAQRTTNDRSTGRPTMNNVQAMRVVKEKFSDIEQRLRRMETHVTSSRFELQREFKKISEEA